MRHDLAVRYGTDTRALAAATEDRRERPVRGLQRVEPAVGQRELGGVHLHAVRRCPQVQRAIRQAMRAESPTICVDYNLSFAF